jgi:osmoprotectant transport system substrate-binding protein
MKRTILMTGATAIAALALAACGANNNPTAPAGGGGGSTGSSGGGGSITVGSADFSESQVLGEIYAGAIKAKGISVTTKPNIGSRDVYIKALQDGSIDIVPEYTGSLLTFLKGTAPSQDPDAVYSALKSTLPPTVVVLDKSTAEDKNSMVVTKDTAAKYSLKSIADLAAHQADITVAAPPEFQTRQQGLVGLKSEYAFTPANFLPLKGAAIVNALTNKQAQAANIFSTDPSISSNGFVTLDDPKLLFGSDNVVPLMRKDKVNDTITAALNAVSAKIDTPTLTDLVKQVDVDKKDASAVAKDFLSKNGLGG